MKANFEIPEEEFEKAVKEATYHYLDKGGLLKLIRSTASLEFSKMNFNQRLKQYANSLIQLNSKVTQLDKKLDRLTEEVNKLLKEVKKNGN